MTEESRRDWRTIDAVIPASESLTNEIDLGGSRLVGIQMPAAWTAAAISFAVSPEAGTANLMPARPGDILADADFAFWTKLIGTETVAASTIFWHGPKALSIITPGGVVNEGTYSPQVPVHRSTAYTASCYLRGAVAGGTVEIAIAWYTGAGAFISETAVPVVTTLTTSYQRAHVHETSPATAAYALLRVRTRSAPAGAQAITFYLDAVQIEAAAVETTWVAGGGTWGNPTDGAGNIIAVVAPLVNEYITLAPEATAGFRFIRVRSGAFGAAVAQAAARTIMLVVRPI